MEKYTYLKDLTEEYLHGKLSLLRMEYEDDSNTVVDVIYEDDNKYSFDYKIEVDNTSKKISFITHYCEYGTDHIPLKRYKRFETALCEFLFKH